MSTQHTETLIIGAGQAGLSTGYHLQRRGRSCLIVDGNERVGDNWRAQWDTLRLYTPAKYDGLPGLPFPAPAWHFPHKDEVADFLERYALHWDLPVRMSTWVDRLEPRDGGGYLAWIGADTISCDNAVVATGTFGRTPYVPSFAEDLDPSIRRLHSSEYRRPSQLRPGPVLVVGASHSGTDIAYEVARTHETILCGRDCGQIPVRLESRRAHVVLPVMVFVFRHVLTRRTPMGRKVMNEVRFHGGPSLRVKRADLAARGVERVTARVAGVSGGRPLLDDGRMVDCANVIWATGFQQVFDWIDLPVLDANGWPVEYRGAVEAAPGLFFCGLSFQYAFASMVFPGVGRDAEYVARRVVSRTRSAVPAAA
ncbi:flavin-containing monooxygenase [Pseudonocardia asaccharolytica]|uniref:Oxidoreductase n=1 Tax=Pseudonocardia asaccharolytica DSM 44247 = NBRC 16224 TaxID=1123024 RepID=A0A511D4Y5_9PSEU|nr:NAD(P)/FAD-dependent oxidoreductase [Pseudonocardia asaccharolytica]GEL17988.1 oxidoreductase [Pseudonocardia asaccharolytica DSM 44247 = NBRC 16224]